MSGKLSDDLMVSLVTGACILVLAVVSKYVLDVELDFVSQYGPVWMYIAYIIMKDSAKDSAGGRRVLFWSTAIILVTVAILAVYALWTIAACPAKRGMLYWPE